jgi:hypothetical protein
MSFHIFYYHFSDRILKAHEATHEAKKQAARKKPIAKQNSAAGEKLLETLSKVTN